jgi:hypothetical protein
MSKVKNTTLGIFLLLTNLPPLIGQDNAQRMLLSSYKQMVYVELEGQYATVFKLGRVLDPGHSGFSIHYIDTLIMQPGINNVTYTGKRTQLSLIGNKYFLDLAGPGLKKDKQIELNTSDNVGRSYLEINNAYWWDVFVNLCNEINSRFKWQHYSFRGYNDIELGGNERLPFESFKVFADTTIGTLRKRLTAIHTDYTLIANEVINNIETIEYGLLKESLVKVGEKPEGSGYFNAIIQTVCKSRPEWFYQLAEDMPTKKEMMFNSVYGHKIVKNLKAVKTDSPVKKEFIKLKRKDRGFTFTVIGTSIAGAALLGFALLTLIN